MSNRRAILIYFSLKIRSERSFRFSFPFPLIFFLSISDLLEDAAFFIPPVSKNSEAGKLSPSAARQIIQTCADLLRSFALKSEPLDFLDIDVNEDGKRFALKLSLK